MTHISIYIGETLKKQTKVIDKTTITHDHHFIFVAFIMSITGTPMSATTTGLIPLNALITYSLSLKFVKNIATSKMMRKGGRQLAIVATTLPLVPRSTTHRTLRPSQSTELTPQLPLQTEHVRNCPPLPVYVQNNIRK